ncbi:MAG: YeiH family protein [Clostridium sp.]|nr:YeiH family protein [Clostridium sp.]
MVRYWTLFQQFVGDFAKYKIRGIALCACIAATSFYLSGENFGGFSLEIIGAPVLSILTGMALSLLDSRLAEGPKLVPGIKFTSKKILQWAVVILGFTLNLGTIATVGAKSLPVIVCTITTSLVVAFVMMKVLGMDPKVSTLIGVGSSICGGSAIAATAPVIEADDDEVAQAISVIFLFNVLAALIFPTLGYRLGLGSEGFAVFAGTAVNDTSSVTAAASTAEGIYGVDGILSAAVTVKLTRTLAIIPITLGLAMYRTYKAKQAGTASGDYSIRKIFPFFILFFVLAACITTAFSAMNGASAGNSSLAALYMTRFVPRMKALAKFFIAMAMAAIGLNTDFEELIRKGAKPLIMGFCCWAGIIAMSLGVQLATGLFYSNL